MKRSPESSHNDDPKPKKAKGAAEPTSQQYYLQFAAFEQYINVSYRQATDIKDGETISVMNENDDILHYQVHRLKTSNPALLPVVLTPVEGSDDIKILFQGTSTLAGWGRNISGFGGAGYDSFLKEKDQLLMQLIAILKKLPPHKRKKISFIGHSLGGSDAQNMIVAVMIEMLAGKTLELSEIQDLQLCVFNSGGVPQHVADKSDQLAIKLKQLGKSIAAYVLIAGGDLVQQTGEAMCFANLSPEIGLLILAKIKTTFENSWKETYDLLQVVKAGFGTLMVHTSRYFSTNPSHSLDIVFYTNQNPEHRKIIEAELKCKIAATQPLVYSAAQAVKYSLSQSGITVENVCETAMKWWQSKSEEEELIEQKNVPHL